MLYRLPDLAGLERYRPMFCGELEPREAAKPRFPDEQAPPGCREIAGDKTLLNPPGGEDDVWISCDRGARGFCALRPYWQSFWSVRVDIPSSELEKWRDYSSAMERLLNQFLVRIETDGRGRQMTAHTFLGQR